MAKYIAGKRPSAAAPYLGLFRMRLIRGLSYRAAAIAGICTQFFWGFMLITIFQAFARSGLSPMNDSQLASYVWLQQAFLVLIVLWFRDSELLRSICSGDAAYELCRPIDLHALWFARLLGGRMASAALRCLPILLLAFFLPQPWALRPPVSPLAFGAFALSLGAGACLMTAIALFAYAITMVSLHMQLGFLLLIPPVEFLAGMLVPLPFFPEWAQPILRVLPFRYVADLPFRLWSGSIPLLEAPRLIGLQFAWLALALLGSRMALKAALRRHQVPGG